MPALTAALERFHAAEGADREVDVLVVEDSHDQAQLLTRHLERAGCRVTVVGTAEEAIPEVRRRMPRVAIVDLHLPGMSGWQLIARLRREPDACAVVATSVIDPADFPPADAALPKPYTGAHVRRMLAFALDAGSAL